MRSGLPRGTCVAFLPTALVQATAVLRSLPMEARCHGGLLSGAGTINRAHSGALLGHSHFSARRGWPLNRRWKSGRRLSLGSVVPLLGPSSLFLQAPVTDAVRGTVPQFTPPQAPLVCHTSFRTFTGTPCVYGAPLLNIFAGYCSGPAQNSFASVLCGRHLAHAPTNSYGFST
ncbi:hypothetical protein NDU88_004709 [Pleurodeles waltl]|uniref:Secreted protein n=1 Tax=Pleurodeles waltl TaxID=8319 RepID=A0AAV7T8D4_PLEWA|nr:hypothetical protein NDU88_004709 [Pleurodeles waltl]